MATTIQIRNVPDNVYRTLKARAALAGLPLSDFLLAEIGEVAARPTVDELRRRIARRAAVMPSVPPAEAVRQERETGR